MVNSGYGLAFLADGNQQALVIAADVILDHFCKTLVVHVEESVLDVLQIHLK